MDALRQIAETVTPEVFRLVWGLPAEERVQAMTFVNEFQQRSRVRMIRELFVGRTINAGAPITMVRRGDMPDWLQAGTDNLMITLVIGLLKLQPDRQRLCEVCREPTDDPIRMGAEPVWRCWECYLDEFHIDIPEATAEAH